jgi:excisionase family DNA binding protein
MERYFTPAEVANRLGVTRETVYSLISRGQLDAYKFGRSRRITEQQITECLNRRSDLATALKAENDLAIHLIRT